MCSRVIFVFFENHRKVEFAKISLKSPFMQESVHDDKANWFEQVGQIKLSKEKKSLSEKIRRTRLRFKMIAKTIYSYWMDTIQYKKFSLKKEYKLKLRIVKGFNTFTNFLRKIRKIFATFRCYYEAVIHRKKVIFEFSNSLTSTLNDICFKNYFQSSKS